MSTKKQRIMNNQDFKKVNNALTEYWKAYKAYFAAKYPDKKMGKYIYRSLQVSIFAEAKKDNVVDVCTSYLSAAQQLQSETIATKLGCGKIVLAATEPIKEALSWWIGLTDQTRQKFIKTYVNAPKAKIVSSIYINVLGLNIPHQK